MRSEEGAVEATIVMSAFLTLMLGMIEFAQALLDLEHDDARGSRRADATRWSTMRRPAQRVPASSCSASPATLANCAVAKGKCCLGGLSVAERHRQLHRGSCQLHCCCEAVANEPWSCRSSLQSVTCNGGGLSISGGIFREKCPRFRRRRRFPGGSASFPNRGPLGAHAGGTPRFRAPGCARARRERATTAQPGDGAAG